MTFIIIMGIIVGFAFAVGIVASMVVNSVAYRRWKREHKEGWYHTWRRP